MLLICLVFFYPLLGIVEFLVLLSGMSYVRTLTTCLLLVYFVSAAGCHCFDLDYISNEIVEEHKAKEGLWT